MGRRGKRADKYLPPRRWPDAFGLPQTAERMALSEAMLALRRDQLTHDERLVAIAIARMFADIVAEKDRRLGELQDDILYLRRNLPDAG